MGTAPASGAADRALAVGPNASKVPRRYLRKWLPPSGIRERRQTHVSPIRQRPPMPERRIIVPEYG